jgi:hypothetical protein
MPGPKHSIAAHTKQVARLRSKIRTEKQARQLAERELRVLRRIVFRLEDQTDSVRVSLKLINHVSK